jgi:hypothetical protein
MAYKDAKKYEAFYKDLIKNGVYPDGTKVTVKKIKHSNEYTLEFWMPKLRVCEDVASTLTWPKMWWNRGAKLKAISKQIGILQDKIKAIAKQHGYKMRYAEVDPDETTKLRVYPHEWEEDLHRGNNWGVDENLNAHYIDLHILNDNLPFDGRKKKQGHILYDQHFRQQREGRLEKTVTSGTGAGVGVTALISLIGGIFFLSSNITGNAIANVSQNSSNVLGAVLLVVGLVAGLFYFKSKK